jgi:hypothetical protein
MEQTQMSFLSRVVREWPTALAAGAMMLTAAACAPHPAAAQSGTNIQTLVMLEDADPRSVVRTSNIAKRVTAELKRSMQDAGFRMVDEEMIAAELGWNIVVRRPKLDLIEAMNMANLSNDAAIHVRAMATFSIFASVEHLDFSNKIQVRIDGELYDALTKQFIGGWEMPRQSYPAPAECNDACLSEIVGDHARDIAVSVGDVLSKQLLAISPGPHAAPAMVAQPAPAAGTAPVSGAPHPDNRCAGMVTTYSLNFRRFTDTEVLQLVNVMTAGPGSGFPCFSSYEQTNAAPGLQSFGYVSTASVAKLREWLSLVLLDMGLNPDSQVSFLVSGNSITLDKITPQPTRLVVPGPRFQ